MLSIPVLKQKNGHDCGPTCVAMVGRFYDRTFSRARLLRACNIDRNGMSNDDLVQALKKLGFSVSARSRNSWKDLRENYRKRLPTIIAWMMHGYIGHFSVVVEVGKNHVRLADPDNGRHRKLPKEVFMRLWFDYDNVFFPKRAKDVHLRWAVVVRGSRNA